MNAANTGNADWFSNFRTAPERDWTWPLRGAESHAAVRHPAPRDLDGQSGPRRRPVVFAPLDLSPASFEAAQAGLDLARDMEGQLVLFHCIYLNLTPFGPANPAWLIEGLRREAREKMQPLMKAAGTAGVAAISAVEEGSRAKVIAQAARQWGADLMVLTAGRAGFLARLLGPSLTDGLIREAKCPVIVLYANKKRNLIKKIFS